jgi:hypothetical protein
MTNRLLFSILERDEPKLAKALSAIRESALEIWTEQAMRTFTAHGEQHFAQVETNLDRLCTHFQKTDAGLNSQEIFVLLAACYLHDIGMQSDEPNARAEHAQFAYDLILHSSAQIGPELRKVTLPIPDDNWRRAIAHIARAHWTQFAVELPETDFIFGNETGRYRLLGLLLAMADLLDLSPVRARYFRTLHRLYKLGPVSELHQTMHALVRGFQIVSPNAALAAELQFQLHWRDDGEITSELADWISFFLTSQWRQLHRALTASSSGEIRWVDQWSCVYFHPPEGPLPALSSEALSSLRAERTEQIRIDRETIANEFTRTLSEGGTCVLLLPSDSDSDGQAIANWCETHARVKSDCAVAKVVIQELPWSLPGVVSALLEQWGEHMPKGDKLAALCALGTFTASENRALVAVVESQPYRPFIETVMAELLKCPNTTPRPARVMILLVPGNRRPRIPRTVAVWTVKPKAFSQTDIESHLRQRRGFDETESSQIFSRIASLGLADKPGKVYTYIEQHCTIESGPV